MKHKIINKKLFYVILLSFVSLSLFVYNCSVVLADLKPFTLKNASIIEKSESVNGTITNNTDSIIDNDIVFHKRDVPVKQ